MSETAVAQPAAPRIATRDGVLEGVLENGLRVFRGIPYAAPPVGALRWRAPAAVEPWRGARAAERFAPACLQKPAPKEPERSLGSGLQSEDCLYLNVWTPQGPAPLAGWPVMVWVHGGGFRFGAGSLDAYDGAMLARQGLIVVTINYRLGLFGTFAHPAVRQAGEPGGDFGLLDVVAALRWVRTNAQAFGGDRDAMTLAGESAGGLSTAYLMTSPLAHGLFQRAIVQSGGLAVLELDRAQAEARARRIATALHAESAAALRALPAEALRDADLDPTDTMPFIDGDVVRAKLRDAFTAGDAAGVPLLIGTNDAEAGFFGPRYWKTLPDEVGPVRWAMLSPLCFGYGAASADGCAEQVATERFAGVGSRALARAASAKAPVYAYRFAWVAPAERREARGAIHTAEIPYVFGHVAGEDAASATLSRRLLGNWAAFVRTGDPALPDAPWPRFVAGAETVLRIGPDEISAGPNPAGRLLDEIDALDLPPLP